MWLLLAFLSAALLGFYDVFKKQSLKNNAVIPVLTLNTLFSSLIFLPLYCVVGMASRYIGRRTFFCSRGRVGGASIYHFEICHCPFFLDIGVFRHEESSDNHCGTD